MNKFLFVLLLQLSSLASASTFSELVEQQEVRVNAYLDRQSAVVAEQVILNIEILSRYPFSEATVIGQVGVKNAIVMKQSPFAINSLKKIAGQQYIHQLWEIPIYAQESGKQIIPPVAVSLAVNKGQESIGGKLFTPQLSYKTYAPSPYMTPSHHWIVANNATLQEQINVIQRAGEGTSLTVGDVVERQVTLKADNSTSMLFPILLKESEYTNKISSQYMEQGRFIDRNTRQGQIAEHIEKVSLVVEKPGTLLLPEIEVIWWDLDSNSEQRLVLPSYQYQVQHNLASFIKAYWYWIVAITLFIVVLIHWGIKLKQHILALKKANAMPTPYKFFHALFRREWGKAESAAYLRLNKRHSSNEFNQGGDSKPWSQCSLSIQQKRYSEHETAAMSKQDYYRLWRKL